jgi:hypothetical protein
MHGCESFADEKLEELSCDDSVDGGELQADPIVTKAGDPEISLHAIAGSISGGFGNILWWFSWTLVATITLIQLFFAWCSCLSIPMFSYRSVWPMVLGC